MRAMFLTGLTIEDMKSRMETTRFWQPAFAEEAREATDNAEGHLLNRAWSESVADDGLCGNSAGRCRPWGGDHHLIVSAIVMCLLVVLLHLICDEQTPRPPFDSGPIPSLTSAVYLPGARR
jgi:hypothetical protein